MSFGRSPILTPNQSIPPTGRFVSKRNPATSPPRVSAETFPIARARFGFLDRFRGIVVSGDERVAKPEPAIYRILLERHGLDPAATVFIDDREENLAAARAFGIDTIRFTDPGALADALRARGLPV